MISYIYIFYVSHIFISRLYLCIFFVVDARSKDKKYEMIKIRYWQLERNFKASMEKYVSAKNKTEKLEKKLVLSEMQRGTPRSAYQMMETPLSDSGISSVHSSTG